MRCVCFEASLGHFHEGSVGGDEAAVLPSLSGGRTYCFHPSKDLTDSKFENRPPMTDGKRKGGASRVAGRGTGYPLADAAGHKRRAGFPRPGDAGTLRVDTTEIHTHVLAGVLVRRPPTVASSRMKSPAAPCDLTSRLTSCRSTTARSSSLRTSSSARRGSGRDRRAAACRSRPARAPRRRSRRPTPRRG